jgi:hypothetical protein
MTGKFRLTAIVAIAAGALQRRSARRPIPFARCSESEP